MSRFLRPQIILALLLLFAARGHALEFTGVCNAPVLGPEVLRRLATEPASVVTAYELCRHRYLEDTRQVVAEPVEDQVKAIFAMQMAYSSRPYGGSAALTARELYAAEALDCDNLNVLASLVYDALDGDAPWRFVGFFGGALGNHSVAILETPQPLLIDPTIALAAPASFDELVSGKPLQVTGFHWRDEIGFYRRKITSALIQGTTRPSDLMYWFPDVASYIATPASSQWKTTPGAHTLRLQLEEEAAEAHPD